MAKMILNQGELNIAISEYLNKYMDISGYQHIRIKNINLNVAGETFEIEIISPIFEIKKRVDEEIIKNGSIKKHPDLDVE